MTPETVDDTEDLTPPAKVRDLGFTIEKTEGEVKAGEVAYIITATEVTERALGRGCKTDKKWFIRRTAKGLLRPLNSLEATRQSGPGPYYNIKEIDGELWAFDYYSIKGPRVVQPAEPETPATETPATETPAPPVETKVEPVVQTKPVVAVKQLAVKTKPQPTDDTKKGGKAQKSNPHLKSRSA
jgi:hypothetical protein